MKKIVIDIDEEGNIALRTSGFPGLVCLEESHFLKEALGKEMTVQLAPVYVLSEEADEKQYLPICG